MRRLPRGHPGRERRQLATSSDPGLYLDSTTGKLYVYVSRTSDSTAGVACVDTTNTATPFCGFTALSAVGKGPSGSGAGDVGDLIHAGHYLYAFNYAQGYGQTGTLNKMLCYDLGTGAASCRAAVQRQSRVAVLQLQRE